MSFFYELIFYLLIFIVIYKLYKVFFHSLSNPSAANKSRHTIHRPILRGIKVQPQSKVEIQLSKLIKRDPDFNQEQLIERVEKAFYNIREAWSTQSLSQVRAFITDGFYERYAIQFDIQKKHKRVRTLIEPRLLDCVLVGVVADKYFESVHFKICSQARNYTITTKNYNAVLSSNGSKVPEKIKKMSPLTNNTEYWTYTRLPDKENQFTAGVTEAICPNCGAKLLLNKFEKCTSCHSLVTSGAYDWVLTKITEEDEWRFQNATREIKGVAEYKVVDPAFNISVIEDRVCVIFWRLQKSWLLQSAKAILSVAHPEYIEHFTENELNDYYFDHINLTLSEVTSIEFGAEFDKVFVLVKWRAEKIDKRHKETGDTHNYAHHLVMIRKHGVVSHSKKGLHSLRCFSCGAPQVESYHEHCQYCRTRFNGGEGDWVLSDFSPRLKRSVKLKGKSFSKNIKQCALTAQIFDPVALLSNLVLMMKADGVLGEKEFDYLNAYVKQHRIPANVLSMTLDKAERGELAMPFPDEKLDATTWLLKMIEMSLSDNNISSEEHTILLEFGHKFNMLPLDIDLRIKQVKINNNDKNQ